MEWLSGWARAWTSKIQASEYESIRRSGYKDARASASLEIMVEEQNL